MMKHLVQAITDLNTAFGQGWVERVTINLIESSPDKGEWYGTVIRRIAGKTDERMYKVSGGYVIFLSHKRKLQGEL